MKMSTVFRVSKLLNFAKKWM